MDKLSKSEERLVSRMLRSSRGTTTVESEVRRLWDAARKLEARGWVEKVSCEVEREAKRGRTMVYVIKVIGLTTRGRTMLARRQNVGG